MLTVKDLGITYSSSSEEEIIEPVREPSPEETMNEVYEMMIERSQLNKDGDRIFAGIKCEDLQSSTAKIQYYFVEASKAFKREEYASAIDFIKNVEEEINPNVPGDLLRKISQLKDKIENNVVMEYAVLTLEKDFPNWPYV